MRMRLISEGLQECLTCDLIGPTLLDIIQDSSMPSNAVIKVLNPTSVEQSILRTSLLPGLLQAVKYNLDHQNHQINAFEIGRVHFKENDQYREQSVAAIVLSGQRDPKNWGQATEPYDFFDMKGIVENLLSEFGITGANYKNLNLSTLHAGRQASVFIGEIEVGSFGEVHPAVQRRLDAAQRILFAEFNLHDLLQVAKKLEKVQPLPLYPGSERDWTITLDSSIPYEAIEEAVKQQHTQLLESVSLVGIYRSEKLGPHLQNVTLHFVYRDLNKTISQESVEAEHLSLTTEAAKKLSSYGVSP
jgi:phenylalanyl-tRNA synthetase beta chain